MFSEPYWLVFDHVNPMLLKKKNVEKFLAYSDKAALNTDSDPIVVAKFITFLYSQCTMYIRSALEEPLKSSWKTTTPKP